MARVNGKAAHEANLLRPFFQVEKQNKKKKKIFKGKIYSFLKF
jgi:hypothetical protein